MEKGYQKGLADAEKEQTRYINAREKAVNAAISKVDKQFKAKPKPKKKVAVKKKAAPKKKATAKKKAAKK